MARRKEIWSCCSVDSDLVTLLKRKLHVLTKRQIQAFKND